ncbi:MAG: ribonuclease R [Betaproteobacteria bacterium]|nr:ribonuclease R [Betaproteobacteria bacterium]
MIVEGIVQGHRDGYGLVVSEQEPLEVVLPAQQMRAVMHLDRVRVRVVRQDRRGRPEGQVLEIVERSKRPVIGRLLQESGVWLLAPEDKRHVQDILIAPGGLGGAKAGQVVSVEITGPVTLHAQPMGRVTEVLGALHDPGMEIEIAVRKYGVPHSFSEAAEKASAALPSQVRAADRAGRVDLTDVPLVTIDGEDARDFDDAVYCEPAKVGRRQGFRLVVAIADVSHYVRPGEPLDLDALDRATSVYFPRRVIPMLPEKLSNGLCSLNPNVERLCVVCDMLIDAEGELRAYQFYPAVMRSHARLTYTEVAEILENTKGPQAQARADLVPHLLNLYDVFSALLKSRRERGAVDLEVPETHIICDANGRIEQIALRQRNEAHRVIEECMLAANVCAADFLQRNKHPGLYRVHEGPTPERLALLRSFLQALGLGGHVGDEPTPADYQRLSDAARERPDAQQINTLMLRSMQQAIYSPHNSGHFGLAYEAYAHFTSPIRRYPDLLTHRAIKALLQGGRYRLQTPEGMQAPPPPRGRRAAAQQAKPAAPAPRGAKVSADVAQWELVGLHCSANERRADEATRDVESWLKCWYMRDKLGEEFIGSITAVTSFGIFVQLSALFVEGLIHISELGAEYFRFDEARNELRGERTGKRYALGDRVLVQVSRVDLDGRRIDFRMVSDPLRPAAVPGTRKRGRKAQAAAAAEDSDHSVFTLPPAQAPAAEPAAPAARKNRKAGKGAGDKAAAQTPADKPTDKAPKTPKAAKSPTRNARSTRARTPRQPATRSRRGGK